MANGREHQNWHQRVESEALSGHAGWAGVGEIIEAVAAPLWESQGSFRICARSNYRVGRQHSSEE
jgi:hypothetical protein